LDREGILLTVAYDGRSFAGWAPQPGQRTVAGVLLEALRALRPDVAEVRGASRTDAGVHARGQRAAFDAPPGIGPRGWALGAAAHLPDTVSIRRASRVPAGLQPRFASRGKRYVYTLLRDPVRDPFVEGFAWRIGGPLDVARMQAEAMTAIGTHDFAAFRSSADERTSTTRTIGRLDVSVDACDARLLRLTVEGDGFLHNMVRILAGTLVDVGRGHLEPGAFARGLASHDRRDLGQTAPPGGLCLDEIRLDDEGSDAWPAPGEPPGRTIA
jgi:tRNA pseudouridine38-40 synthase